MAFAQLTYRDSLRDNEDFTFLVGGSMALAIVCGTKRVITTSVAPATMLGAMVACSPMI